MLESHPTFGDLPPCTHCGRRAWLTLYIAEGEARRIGVFQCAASGHVGTAHAPVDLELDTVDGPDGDAYTVPDEQVEFSDAFDI